MKAASKSQGPKRWRREEHLGLAGEGSGVGWSGRVPANDNPYRFQRHRNCWSGKVSANEIYNISTRKEIPVTAESTNAEAEAMKLGPMDGGRELKEIKPYQYCTDRKTMSRLSKPGSSGRS